MTKVLPFAVPDIGDEEIDKVSKVLRSGWLTTGSVAKQFERDFARYTKARNSLAVSSATAGLHLALEAVGVGRGDTVVTTPYTFTATAEVIHYLGATPVFVDIDIRTFNINPVELGRVLMVLEQTGKPLPKAIIPVHFAGQSCDMKAIRELAYKYGIMVVGDAAHALPCTYEGLPVSKFEDITVYSFYATKTITTGEGGMVTTDNDKWAQRVKTMRLHGISQDVFGRYQDDKPAWYYEVVAPGFKYNMPDVAAAIGVSQLKKADKFRARRAEIRSRYNVAFEGLPFECPYVAWPADTHSWHLYVIQLHLEVLSITRDEFIEAMTRQGVGVSVHFIPLHIHPYWRDQYGFQANDFPVAYDVYRRAVSLPIYPRMTDADVAHVIKAVCKVCKEGV